MRVAPAAGEDGRSAAVYFASAEKQISNFRFNLNNFLGHQPMCLAMHLHGSFGAGGLAQAKDFACALVYPVLVIVNAILALHFHIMRMSLRYVVGGDPTRDLVDIHVGWHSR